MKDPLSLIVRWLILSAAVWAAAEIIPGIDYDGLASVLVVAGLLGIANLYVKPVLTFLSCPVIILTLGFFLLVVNAAMLGLASWVSGVVGADFSVDGFWSALFGAVVISLVSYALSQIVKPERFSGST